MEGQSTEVATPKVSFWHKLFATTPGKGMQPKEAIMFSICGFGQNMICCLMSAYIVYFLTEAIGFGAWSVALMMLFARIFDALNDPIMGSIVDRTRTKWGKCRPYLRWMAIPIAITTILCFLPYYPNSPGGFVAITAMYIIWSVVYTVSDVPYWGLSSSMTNDGRQRANLLTIARLVCTAGAGLVSLVVPIITSSVTSDLTTAEGVAKAGMEAQLKSTLGNTYFIIAIVVVVLALPMFYLGFKYTKEHIPTIEKPKSLGHNLKLLTKNKPLILIIISGVLGGARTVFLATGGLYFCQFALSDTSLLGMSGVGLFTIITLSVVPGGLIASALVPFCQKKFGKKWTYIATHLLGGAIMLVVYFCGYKEPWALIVALIGLILVGIPQGFANVLTYAMIGDSVDYLEHKTGERGEGICFAMQTLINKIGIAIGAFVGVLAYAMSGLQNSTEGHIPADGLDKLWLGLTLVAALSMFATTIPLFFYRFNEKEQQAAVAEINARRETAALAAEGANGEDIKINEFADQTSAGSVETITFDSTDNNDSSNSDIE